MSWPIRTRREPGDGPPAPGVQSPSGPPSCPHASPQQDRLTSFWADPGPWGPLRHRHGDAGALQAWDAAAPGLGPRGPVVLFAPERWGMASTAIVEGRLGSQSFNPMKVTPAICGCFRKRKRKNVEAAPADGLGRQRLRGDQARPPGRAAGGASGGADRMRYGAPTPAQSLCP